MRSDAELLREFVNRRDESAFTELVNRHISVVYSAACRETRDDFSAAEDVTQLVFIELARKAENLQRHPSLAGWLYTSVRYLSANLRRANHRRRIREEEARVVNGLPYSSPDDSPWLEVKPVLDDALRSLNERDRHAVRLRFFEGRSLREVGEAFCLKENTARMRVNRALDNLRKLLAQRGIASTSSALVATWKAGFVPARPALMAAERAATSVRA